MQQVCEKKECNPAVFEHVCPLGYNTHTVFTKFKLLHFRVHSIAVLFSLVKNLDETAPLSLIRKSGWNGYI